MMSNNLIFEMGKVQKTAKKSLFLALLLFAFLGAKAQSLTPLTVDELIGVGDSLEIVETADSLARQNPIFLPVVVGSPNVGVVNLEGENELITVRRSAVDSVIKNELELLDLHALDLPVIEQAEIKKKKTYLKVNVVAPQVTALKLETPNWTKGMQAQLHVSQNYISDNWYNGGESNLAGHLYLMGYYNYKNKKNFQWDNKVEYRFGMNSTKGDSLRKFRVNEDLLRINSKAGYRAVKSFFYTAEVDFQTHFFNTFEANTYTRTTGPLSPVRLNLSLGMDYKYKEELTVFVSPLSYKLTYVVDTTTKQGCKSIAQKVGLVDNARQLNQLGALLRVGWKRTFVENITLESYFYLYGAYLGTNVGVELDWEVIGNFKINRFLSAKISLHPRYDTITPTKDGSKPKIQFKELISLGFSYQL